MVKLDHILSTCYGIPSSREPWDEGISSEDDLEYRAKVKYKKIQKAVIDFSDCSFYVRESDDLDLLVITPDEEGKNTFDELVKSLGHSRQGMNLHLKVYDFENDTENPFVIRSLLEKSRRIKGWSKDIIVDRLKEKLTPRAYYDLLCDAIRKEEKYQKYALDASKFLRDIEVKKVYSDLPKDIDEALSEMKKFIYDYFINKKEAKLVAKSKTL